MNINTNTNVMSLMRRLKVSEVAITEGKIRNHDDVFTELGQRIKRVRCGDRLAEKRR
jgi:hypothetical protein